MGIPGIPQMNISGMGKMPGAQSLGAGSGNSSLFSSLNAGSSGMPSFGLPGMGSPTASGSPMASLGLPSDITNMMTMITGMMVPIMSMITQLLAGIMNGSISSKAPEDSSSSSSTSGTPTSFGTNASSGSGGSGSQTTGPVAPGTKGALDRASALMGKKGGDPAIDAITKKSGLSSGSQPWCAAFAMNILKDAGVIDTTGLSNLNYTPTIHDWAKANGIWGTKGQYTPKAGDAVEFDWGGGSEGSIDHIGIVESVKTDANGKVISITVLEGNSSNSVARNTYGAGGKDMSSIAGYVISGKDHPGKKV